MAVVDALSATIYFPSTQYGIRAATSLLSLGCEGLALDGAKDL